MSLDHILLGILREPAAGYDIKQQFEQVFNHFWYADLAQIYRSLNRLEKGGLLRSRIEPSDRGPDRKVYRRTAQGTQALDKWLRGGPVFGSEKFAYLAQAFFLGHLHDTEASEEFFTTLREELVAKLEALVAIEQGWKAECGRGFPDVLDDAEFHEYLTLDMGLRKTRALVDWADNALVQLRGRAKSKRKT
ncbi:MAG TPA: PadR family transcriptional regulator [Gammaproteobacteria bacterium]